MKRALLALHRFWLAIGLVERRLPEALGVTPRGLAALAEGCAILTSDPR